MIEPVFHILTTTTSQNALVQANSLYLSNYKFSLYAKQFRMDTKFEFSLSLSLLFPLPLPLSLSGSLFSHRRSVFFFLNLVPLIPLPQSAFCNNIITILFSLFWYIRMTPKQEWCLVVLAHAEGGRCTKN
ncbi:hypothetical protein RYX36_029393 [Vicia faba]